MDSQIKSIFKSISQLHGGIDFQEKLMVLANMGKELVNADRCSIWAYDFEKKEFITKVAHGGEVLHLDAEHGMVGHSFLTKEPLIINDVYDSVFFYSEMDKKTGYKTLSAITLPIFNKDNEVIGIFQALNKLSGDRKFNDEDLQILDLVTVYTSAIFESTLLYEKLQNKQKEIKLINESLEQKVKERTKELEKLKIKAESANQAKSDFLANMSHEIRTPLNAILGFVDILEKDEKDPQRKSYLGIVNKSSKTLLSIISDILDFTKIESGNFELENISFNPLTQIYDVVELFKANALEKSISIKISQGINIPKSIKSDPTRIKQIISNFLSNAVKFTEPNKNIKISINFNDKTSHLTISVEDQGIGIKEEKLNIILNPFSQADNSTTRKYGGTGLGLAICDKLSKLLNGTITVKSQEGIGSIFTLDIPVGLSQEEIVDTDTTIELCEEYKGSYILLVEDNISNQKFMSVLLRKLNIKFDIADDGLEAIEFFKKNNYNLILMDENMPNMNGLQASRYILEFEKQNNLAHTPIVALTANSIHGDREKFLKAGMDEYLSKPLDKTKFLEVLKKFLG